MTAPSPETLGKTHAEVTSGQSPLASYQALIVGRSSFLSLLYFEWCRLLSGVPGALGLVLRKLFWPRLFGSCGKGAVFGGGISLMHPHRIHIGARVVISENCVLDARSPAADESIRLGDGVMLSHGVVISCKNGTASIGERCGIGAYSVIQSLGMNNPLEIGADTVIGPQCYLTSGGDYHMDRLDIPIAQQGAKDSGGTRLGDGVWLGADVSVLGGVTIGRGAVLGTGAVATRDVPEASICGGIPAKVLRYRDDRETSQT
ncbi:MAG: acyltransferase [Pseudomonadota bacterium]